MGEVTKTKKIRTYHELTRLPTFEERYEYLRIGGQVGDASFGFDRYLNQALYRSREWLSVRNAVIIRDDGCDLGVKDRSIGNRIVVHHMNPITVEGIEGHNPDVFDPRYLICTSDLTHRAIHFGDQSLLPKEPVERRPGDTCPWK